jgi:dnd system-associated protein 4
MRAVRRSERHEGIVSQLSETSVPGANRSIFASMRELMCFAAVLGFERDSKKPIDAKTKEIDGRTFRDHAFSSDLIFLIALADTQNAEILREENESDCLSIFEQYAEGGFVELGSWLKERPDDPNGDAAILEGLRKYGFLNEAKDISDAIQDVSF